MGHHFRLSRALTRAEQLHISRQGACLTCHQGVPGKSLAVSFLHHVAKYAGQLPVTNAQQNRLLPKIMLSSAWVQCVDAWGLPAAVGDVLASPAPAIYASGFRSSRVTAPGNSGAVWKSARAEGPAADPGRRTYGGQCRRKQRPAGRLGNSGRDRSGRQALLALPQQKIRSVDP